MLYTEFYSEFIITDNHVYHSKYYIKKISNMKKNKLKKTSNMKENKPIIQSSHQLFIHEQTTKFLVCHLHFCSLIAGRIT